MQLDLFFGPSGIDTQCDEQGPAEIVRSSPRIIFRYEGSAYLRSGNPYAMTLSSDWRERFPRYAADPFLKPQKRFGVRLVRVGTSGRKLLEQLGPRDRTAAPLPGLAGAFSLQA